MIERVGFDGDDTLWHSEGYFRAAHAEFEAIVGNYVDLADAGLHERLLATERRKLEELERVQSEFASYLEASRAADQLLHHVPHDLRLDAPDRVIVARSDELQSVPMPPDAGLLEQYLAINGGLRRLNRERLREMAQFIMRKKPDGAMTPWWDY